MLVEFYKWYSNEDFLPLILLPKIIEQLFPTCPTVIHVCLLFKSILDKLSVLKFSVSRTAVNYVDLSF